MREIAALFLFLPLLFGCDWGQYHFVNSIPLHVKGPKDVYAYIGLDGLSYKTTLEAMRRGCFNGGRWRLAKFVTMFPGTSDASWTRILHAKPIPGYEYEYYDPATDALQNTGIIGILRHVFPPITEGSGTEPEYYKAFDYRGNGYLHGITGYSQPFMSAYESLDNMFVLLEGRTRTKSAFSAYMLETDMLGHSEADPMILVHFLERIDHQIKILRENHPDQNFHFTLFSDHGIDFTPIADPEPVVFEEEMKKVGIEPVESIRNRDTSRMFALTIRHTRVTYVEMRTAPSLVQPVAKTAALIPAVDVVVARLPSERVGVDAPDAEWFAVYSKVPAGGSDLVLRFGFDRNSNRYLFPQGQSLQRFKLTLSGGRDERDGLRSFSDAELFAQTRHSDYPDLFFRIRTSLSPISVKYPADILISLKEGYPSMGNAVLGGIKDVARAGFHGALRAPGTIGTLLTDEREIPDAVRSDALLQMFPRLQEHMLSRGMDVYEGDSFGAAFSR